MKLIYFIKFLIKKGYSTIYKEILYEQEQLEKQILQIQQDLNCFPEGTLVCKRNGNYNKWYLKENNKLIYLPKEQRKLAESLAKKRYLTFLLAELISEKKALTTYLTYHKSIPFKSASLLYQSSPYFELLSPSFQSQSAHLLEWSSATFEQNQSYPQNLIHKSISGNLLRSKSEVLIDAALFHHKIPFRYECALSLGEFIFYPDFTILHPISHKIIYWEHFGMMDDSTYSKNIYSKLRVYQEHGIIPSIQLITTYETKEHPLTYHLVEKIISHYFE